MKSNRLFYIGIGCVFSTLFWTITAAVVSDNPYNKQMKEFVVERLICRELSVVNEDDEEIMAMLDTPKGATLIIQKINPLDIEDRTHVSLRASSLSFFNTKNTRVVSLDNYDEYGAFMLADKDGYIKWLADSNKKREKEFMDRHNIPQERVKQEGNMDSN